MAVEASLPHVSDSYYRSTFSPATTPWSNIYAVSRVYECLIHVMQHSCFGSGGRSWRVDRGRCQFIRLGWRPRLRRRLMKQSSRACLSVAISFDSFLLICRKHPEGLRLYDGHCSAKSFDGLVTLWPMLEKDVNRATRSYHHIFIESSVDMTESFDTLSIPESTCARPSLHSILIPLTTAVDLVERRAQDMICWDSCRPTLIRG